MNDLLFRPSSLHLVNYLLPSLLFCFHLRITEIGRASRTVTKENCELRLPSIDGNLGSMSVSEQLHTYLSPNLTFTLSCYQLIIAGLGEGQVRSYSETDINPNCHWIEYNIYRIKYFLNSFKHFFFLQSFKKIILWSI